LTLTRMAWASRPCVLARVAWAACRPKRSGEGWSRPCCLARARGQVARATTARARRHRQSGDAPKTEGGNAPSVVDRRHPAAHRRQSARRSDCAWALGGCSSFRGRKASDFGQTVRNRQRLSQTRPGRSGRSPSWTRRNSDRRRRCRRGQSTGTHEIASPLICRSRDQHVGLYWRAVRRHRRWPVSGPAARIARHFPGRSLRKRPLGFRPKSAHQKDDKAYQQNQAEPAAADDGTSEVKTAAAE